MEGKKIVLAASRSESSEYLNSTWRQMLLATLPAKYLRMVQADTHLEGQTRPDGQALCVPNGVRVIESLLLEHFPADEIAVCHPDQLERFVGDATRVVGLHAHNPLGITFATGIYAHFFGKDQLPVNAEEFQRMIEHPALARHRRHFKLLVGGPGAWQLERQHRLDAWHVDCLVDGEAEDIAVDLFERAARGEDLPRKVMGHSPAAGHIPRIRHRSTFGVVEITRGCGRGCQFCSIALRHGTSLPLEHILDNVRVQVGEGADSILITTEDLFLYEQGPRFQTNVAALERLLNAIAGVPGVKHVVVSHGTMAPVVRDPEVIERLSPVAVGKSIHQHKRSQHPDHRFAMLFIGLETGSPRLFEQFMKGKSYPYKPEQWPEVVLKGMEILNKHSWFPFCTWILGLPGETREDTKQSLDLLYALKDARWCPVPTLFVPLEDTRLGQKAAARAPELTDLQWEFFFTCWRYNLDFFRNTPAVQWKFHLGIPLYYYSIGRRTFGKNIKYPLFRLGHFPERWMRRHLYLGFDRAQAPRYSIPEEIKVPERASRPSLPEA
ncbi:MAG: B12-binding domain-containing radical SAM protein [Terriglobales bacterium]